MRTVTNIIMTIGRGAAWCAVLLIGAGFLVSFSMVVYSFAGTPGVAALLAVCAYLGWHAERTKRKAERAAKAQTPQVTPYPPQAMPPFVPSFPAAGPFDPSWHPAPGSLPSQGWPPMPPTASPHVEACAREYGRFLPARPGRITILPPNQE